MGLDMYLAAKKYVSAYYFRPKTEKDLFKNLIAASGLVEADLDRETPSGEVKFTVAYWRKANQIHKWFVDNVQEGVDECQDSDVDRAQLESLLKICQEIMADKSKAMELLPPQGGFFFGSTDLDEWYFRDIENTISQLTRIIESPNLKDWDFVYHSSW